MSMTDGSADEEKDPNESGLSSNGLQGADMTAAMTRALTKPGTHTADQAALERGIAKGRAMEANRTYEMLNAVPAAPFVPVRRNDPS
jgi:hypothetical protein